MCCMQARRGTEFLHSNIIENAFCKCHKMNAKNGVLCVVIISLTYSFTFGSVREERDC